MFVFNDHRPTQAIVDLACIRANVQSVIETLQPHQQVYATVKADGYGHGALPIAKAAIEAGATGLAVATVDEGIELRENGFQHIPILILGLTDSRGIAEILHYRLTITVSSSTFFARAYRQLEETEQLDLLKEEKVNFHLALDTGMGRIGLRTVEEVEVFIEAMRHYPWAKWEGVFTHFSTAGGGPEEFIDEQYETWQTLLSVIPDYVVLRHIANSGMALWHNDTYPSDIIRLGISMYGMSPKDQLEDDVAKLLKPSLSLVSEIIYVKKVPKGTKISYGATYEAQAEEWIATIPIGYADGWLRHYANIPILVDQQACPVVGVINMDQLMIRLPKYYPIGTNVTLIGQNGSLNNHPAHLAKLANTISYEIFTSLSKRVPRIYLNE